MDEKLIEPIKQPESITSKVAMAMIFLCSGTVIIYIILMYQDIHQIYIDVNTASTVITQFADQITEQNFDKLREDLSEINTCVLNKYCKRVPD
jgi:hypothetical protein